MESVAKGVVTIGAPLLAVVGQGSKKRRLRRDISENLGLIDELQKRPIFQEYGFVSGWLEGRVAVDIARLTDQNLGDKKKPVPYGSVVVALLITAGFGFWTYWIDRNGFVWYSVFPGLGAATFALSVYGMIAHRDLAPGEESLPPGAVRAPTDTATERVASAVAFAAAGELDERYAVGGQVDVALTFVALMQQGNYTTGIVFADENWLRCRVNAWLWNNRSEYGDDVLELERIAADMLRDRDDDETWLAFVASESNQFATAWGPIDLDGYGTASRRRIISRDLDLVILVNLGPSGDGYWVMTATAIPDAMPILVRRVDDRWLVANHLGHASPVPDWPPIWWTTDDPAMQALAEDS